MLQYGMVLIGFLSSLPHIILVILYFINIRMYHITNKKTILTICKKLPNRSTMISDSDKMTGYIWGYKYIGYITTNINSDREDKMYMYLITTKKYYETINMNTDEPCDDKYNGIDVYDRFGNYFCLEYSKRTNIIEFNSSPKQKEIIENILNFYNMKNNISRSVVVLLSGPTGSGKSTLPFILASDLKCSICKTYNPTEPGDDLSVLYNTVNPNKDKPLIILLDEIDIIINNINNNNITLHKTIPIKIKDKTSWNGFWDDINRGDFKYTIWVLTTNKSFDYFDAIDPSYTRPGRINIKITL